jgi:hypothetical protein
MRNFGGGDRAGLDASEKKKFSFLKEELEDLRRTLNIICYQIMDNEMGMACGTYGGEKCV